VHGHASENHHRETAIAIRAKPVVTPSRLEDYRKHKRVNDKQQHWVKKGPGETDKGTTVSRHHVAACHKCDQGAVANK
jgi:hypothetical protein